MCLTIVALHWCRPDVRQPSLPDPEALAAYRKVRAAGTQELCKLPA